MYPCIEAVFGVYLAAPDLDVVAGLHGIHPSDGLEHSRLFHHGTIHGEVEERVTLGSGVGSASEMDMSCQIDFDSMEH